MSPERSVTPCSVTPCVQFVEVGGTGRLGMKQYSCLQLGKRWWLQYRLIPQQQPWRALAFICVQVMNMGTGVSIMNVFVFRGAHARAPTSQYAQQQSDSCQWTKRLCMHYAAAHMPRARAQLCPLVFEVGARPCSACACPAWPSMRQVTSSLACRLCVSLALACIADMPCC